MQRSETAGTKAGKLMKFNDILLLACVQSKYMYVSGPLKKHFNATWFQNKKIWHKIVKSFGNLLKGLFFYEYL